MIKFVVTRIAKLLSNRRGLRWSSQGAPASAGTAPAAIRSARVQTAHATRLVGRPRPSGHEPEAGFFDYEDPNDRLAWPARDGAAKPRDAYAALDGAHAALDGAHAAVDGAHAAVDYAPLPPVMMRSLDDVTRLVRPARTGATPADRTVLLKARAFSGRTVADATQIITPRNRP